MKHRASESLLSFLVLSRFPGCHLGERRHNPWERVLELPDPGNSPLWLPGPSLGTGAHTCLPRVRGPACLSPGHLGKLRASPPVQRRRGRSASPARTLRFASPKRRAAELRAHKPILSTHKSGFTVKNDYDSFYGK